MANPVIPTKNQFGEPENLRVQGTPSSSLLPLANALPAKAGVTAIAAIGVLTPAIDQATTNTNIATIQAKVDAILAALKVSS